MPENEEEIHMNMNMNMNINNSPKLRELDSMDLDVDGTWTFDQILSDPMMLSSSPPFFMSADQPFSPLWAFPDDTYEKPGGNATLTTSRGSECTEPVSGNPDATIETPSTNEEKKKQMLPVFEMTPSVYPDGTCVIKEKMTLALRYFKEWSEQHVLAQIWAPVKNGGRFVLTTSGQPFILDPNSIGLYQYRMVSLMYMFSLDGDTDEALGLPGRVFRQKLPEWTPNVQYYSDKEYPRLTHALNYNVQGSLALPVFEPTRKSCVGVLELIMTSQKINYAPEVDKVCKALEAVNLKSSDILEHTNTQICNESRQNALAEILEILTVVCETHKFPLAQTWIPCRHRSVITYGGGLRKNCSSFDGSCMGQVCMSTTDVAFYVVDAHMWGFREACAEHHLQKGQGVAGRAFSSRSSCFCENITRFCKTEYPLVHYARMFGLVSSFAVCLRSSYTGEDDYILEFFLPPNMVESTDQQLMLRSLLMTMKQHFRSLNVASGEEIGEDGKSVEIIKASVDAHKLDSMIESIHLSESITSPPDPVPYQGQVFHLDSLGEPLRTVETEALNSIVQNVGNSAGVQTGFPSSENKQTGKKSDRKRGKAEKSISLEVLQQHFAGSLKDAAKSLGVCPTTMKRICRQHGISRWPSRKINKVNRSLTKLKSVIESVQGAEGRFTMASLATTSLPVVVDSVPWPAVFMPNSNEHVRQNSSSPKSSELQEQKNEPSIRQSSGSEEHGKTESIGTPTSHGSCQGSPNLEIESSQNHQNVSPHKEALVKLAPFYRLENQSMTELDLAAAFSIPDVLLTPQPEEQFGGMLIEDSGSSHDLRNLCSDLLSQNQDTRHFADAGPQEFAASVHEEAKHFPSRPESNSITIKATYKEDIIRFRLGLDAGIVTLKEEVGKRLKLETGTFDIKYLDDDHEWVMIACDADLQECVDISRLSGSSMIRLLVHDLFTVLGSSCESSGEL